MPIVGIPRRQGPVTRRVTAYSEYSVVTRFFLNLSYQPVIFETIIAECLKPEAYPAGLLLSLRNVSRAFRDFIDPYLCREIALMEIGGRVVPCVETSGNGVDGYTPLPISNFWRSPAHTNAIRIFTLVLPKTSLASKIPKAVAKLPSVTQIHDIGGVMDDSAPLPTSDLWVSCLAAFLLPCRLPDVQQKRTVLVLYYRPATGWHDLPPQRAMQVDVVIPKNWWLGPKEDCEFNGGCLVGCNQCSSGIVPYRLAVNRVVEALVTLVVTRITMFALDNFPTVKLVGVDDLLEAAKPEWRGDKREAFFGRISGATSFPRPKIDKLVQFIPLDEYREAFGHKGWL